MGRRRDCVCRLRTGQWQDSQFELGRTYRSVADLLAGMMGKESKGFYEFGQFRMDPARKILLRDGEPVTLTSKALSGKW
jgi:hypothetical protein